MILFWKVKIAKTNDEIIQNYIEKTKLKKC